MKTVLYSIAFIDEETLLQVKDDKGAYEELKDLVCQQAKKDLIVKAKQNGLKSEDYEIRELPSEEIKLGRRNGLEFRFAVFTEKELVRPRWELSVSKKKVMDFDVGQKLLIKEINYDKGTITVENENV